MGLAAEVGAIVDRRLAEAAYPYVLWMSPCGCHRLQSPEGPVGASPRRGDRHGIAVDGDHEVPGIAVSDSEDGICWTRPFPCWLKSRGPAEAAGRPPTAE
jgi:hypothetical protein